MLEKVYVQTSSLEIIKVESLIRTKTLSGENVMPLFSNELNSFSIDYETDFSRAEMFMKGMKVFGKEWECILNRRGEAKFKKEKIESLLIETDYYKNSEERINYVFDSD